MIFEARADGTLDLSGSHRVPGKEFVYVEVQNNQDGNGPVRSHFERLLSSSDSKLQLSEPKVNPRKTRKKRAFNSAAEATDDDSKPDEPICKPFAPNPCKGLPRKIWFFGIS